METRQSLFYGAVIATILLWGTSYTLIGYSVDFISPAWLVAFRTTIAAIVMTIYALLRGHRFPNLRDPVWQWYGFMGFIGLSLPFYLTARGQVYVESGLTAVLAGVMPLITIILAHFFVKGEHLSWRKAIGFFIGFAGIILLFLPIPLKWDLIETWRSQGLILLTAVCYASTTIIAKRAPETSASIGAAIALLAASLLSLLWAFSTGTPKTMPPQSAVIAVVLLAIGGTGIAQILYLRIIKIKGPSYIAKMVYLVPVFSIIAGIFFLDEPFSWRSISALGIIFLGLYISQAGKKRLRS